MIRSRLDSPTSLFMAVALGHFVVDIFYGMASVLMVFVSAHAVQMTNTQLGVALSAFAMAGAISQPLFGVFSDRSGGRWLGVGGVIWIIVLMIVSMVVATTTHNYLLTFIPFALAGLGSGAFHPVGVMHASEVSDKRAASNTSLFFMSGYIGGGIGPLIAGFLLDRSLVSHVAPFAHLLGPALSSRLIEPGNPIPIVVIVALFCLPVPLWMALTLPSRTRHIERRSAGRSGAAKRHRPRGWMPRLIVLFILMVTLRGVVNPGAVTFMPALFQSKGWDAAHYGLIASLASIGAGFAGLGLGILADRWDARYLIALALIVCAPFIFVLSNLSGAPAFISALVVGALSGGPQSLIVLMAQDLLPGRKALASGSILGLMFSIGAIGTLLVGRLADVVGMDTAFRAVAVVALACGLLSLLLPSEQAQDTPEPVAAPTSEYELRHPSA